MCWQAYEGRRSFIFHESWIWQSLDMQIHKWFSNFLSIPKLLTATINLLTMKDNTCINTTYNIFSNILSNRHSAAKDNQSSINFILFSPQRVSQSFLLCMLSCIFWIHSINVYLKNNTQALMINWSGLLHWFWKVLTTQSPVSYASWTYHSHTTYKKEKWWRMSSYFGILFYFSNKSKIGYDVLG
jgi:hypothetical protein